MCLYFYIASDHPLPLKPWSKDNPDFHVSELSKDSRAVKKHFDFSHVRLVGSYEYCGCVFNYGREYPTYEDKPDQLAIANESRTKLIKYLERHNVKQVYSCWAGEEDQPTETRENIKLHDLLNDNFVFKERELLTIER